MAKLHTMPAMLAITGGISLAIMALVHLTAGKDAPPPTVGTPLATTNSVDPPVKRPLLDISARAEDGEPIRPKWAASATGRIETRLGEHRLGAMQPRRIEEVVVKTHDKVKKGDLLVRLDDRDLWAKRDSALAEVEVRLRERTEENVTGLALDRQNAEDRVADAERDLFEALLNLDKVVTNGRNGSASAEAEQKAREDVANAEKTVSDERAAYKRVVSNSKMPKPSRLDTGLTQSRADLALVETAIRNTRIRAPFDGDVLNVWAKVGEVAAPSPSAPLILFGDKSTMRVRAELEERDVVHVRVGQKVIVRSDGHPGKDFVGTVTSLGGALGARNIASRGPRRPSDIDVLEVIADLGAQPELLPGMRVDVFFANDETAKAE